MLLYVAGPYVGFLYGLRPNLFKSDYAWGGVMHAKNYMKIGQ